MSDVVENVYHDIAKQAIEFAVERASELGVEYSDENAAKLFSVLTSKSAIILHDACGLHDFEAGTDSLVIKLSIDCNHVDNKTPIKPIH